MFVENEFMLIFFMRRRSSNFYLIACVFEKFEVGNASINHSHTAHIAGSGFLKKVQETGSNPVSSFNLPDPQRVRGLAGVQGNIRV